MAALHGDFELWLSDKLRVLNIDPDVFGSYITGILEGTETEDEKAEALQGILTEVCEDAISDVKDEIFSKWSEYNNKPAEGDVRVNEQGQYNVEAKLVSLMEEQAKSVVAEKNLSVEEQKLRQAILAQYGEVSDGEDWSKPRFCSDGDSCWLQFQFHCAFKRDHLRQASREAQSGLKRRVVGQYTGPKEH
ncbi:hypothetical protein HPB48_005359 [Haemaphysalis longicornis]|uniref:Coiled-coil domain-containing protein 43 n=1 Tax=Haemaphysalis longicornis TaxID=44386 RepID=A0A9J6GF97_HAELO|nr:hypothetical protein HPB48_005359 [Haemaphysalis longicornis]